MADLSTREPSAAPDYRTCPPGETLARLKPLFSVFGITRVADVTGLDRIGLPVAMVCRPEATSSAVFHGKGLDIASAQVSGVMEAVETWHAEAVRGPLLHASASDLASEDRVADLAGLPLSTHRPIAPGDPLLWIEGKDLLSRQSTWVPFELVHASSALDGPPSSGLLAMDTSGLASGNTLTEATLQGCCELIERDATALWRALRPVERDRRKVDLETVEDGRCRHVLGLFAEARFAVAAWDITTEIGVPAFFAVLRDELSEIGPIGNGAGCHPSPDVALLRALTEAAQTRMTYIVGAREDIAPDDYADGVLVDRNRAARALIGHPGRRPFSGTRDVSAATIKAVLALVLARLQASGFAQVLRVDLSRSLGGVAVARMVIPFLEHAGHGGHTRRGPLFRTRLQAYAA